MLASLLDVRVTHLRVCVDMLENPKSIKSSVEQLKDKIEDGTQFWQYLLHRSEGIRAAIVEREKHLNDMNWVERTLPEFIGGRGAVAERKLAALRDAYIATLESELRIMEGFDSLIQSTKQTLDALKSPDDGLASSPTVVYWRDEAGEHSFYTEKLELS